MAEYGLTGRAAGFFAPLRQEASWFPCPSELNLQPSAEPLNLRFSLKAVCIVNLNYYLSIAVRLYSLCCYSVKNTVAGLPSGLGVYRKLYLKTTIE